MVEVTNWILIYFSFPLTQRACLPCFVRVAQLWLMGRGVWWQLVFSYLPVLCAFFPRTVLAVPLSLLEEQLLCHLASSSFLVLSACLYCSVLVVQLWLVGRGVWSKILCSSTSSAPYACSPCFVLAVQLWLVQRRVWWWSWIQGRLLLPIVPYCPAWSKVAWRLTWFFWQLFFWNLGCVRQAPTVKFLLPCHWGQT